MTAERGHQRRFWRYRLPTSAAHAFCHCQMMKRLGRVDPGFVDISAGCDDAGFADIATALNAAAATSLPGHAESADEAAVRNAIDDLVKAMIAADKAALEAVVPDQLSFGHSNGSVENKAEFVGNTVGKKPIYKSITLGDPTISVVGNNAIARYTAAVELDAGGKAISLKLGVMTVWVKDGGTWKLLAHQSFMT